MTGLEDAVSGLAATTHDTAWQLLQLRGELGDIAEAAEGSTALLGLADVRALLDEQPGRPAHPGQLPHRHPHRLHPGADALGAAPGRLPARPRRRRLPPAEQPRRRRRAGPRPVGRRARPAQRGPPAVPRRHLRRRGPPGHHLHRRRRAHRRARAAGRPARRAARRAGPHGCARPTALRVRDVVTTHHALQPFDPRNFAPVARPGGRSASTRCRTPVRGPPPDRGPSRRRSSPRRCRRVPPADVELADLRRLLTHPARGFLRQRLGVAETRGEDEPADALPVELDNLEQWAVGERVLRERLAGLDPADCIDPRAAPRHAAARPARRRDAARHRAARSRACCWPRRWSARTPPESHDVDVPLADGTRLTGTVGDVRGDTLLVADLLAAGRPAPAAGCGSTWCALTVAQPDRRWRAVAVGRGRGSGAQRSVFDPLPAAEAARRAGRARRALPRRAALAAAAAGQDRRRVRRPTQPLRRPDRPGGRRAGVAHRPVPRRAGGRRARPALRRARAADRAHHPAARGRRGRRRLARRRDRPVRAARPPALGPAARRRAPVQV